MWRTHEVPPKEADLDNPPTYSAAPPQLVQEAAYGTDDGRVEVDASSKVARVLSSFIPDPPDYSSWQTPTSTEPISWTVKLNIVMQVVGSRGDIQPFIALGNELQKHGHRVRLATHDVFQNFVHENGLEFYPIGGDPKELMAYMVKNPSIIPSLESLRGGDISRKRKMIAEMLRGCWESCIEADPVSGIPFVADAVIANPPSFAHIHCAQALGVPIHLMFTMPWSSTRAFSHPLANLKHVGDDPHIANYVSYGVIDWMTWQGLGDVINKFRNGLDLEEINLMDGPMLASSLEIPFTYCWSPSLVPKPADWPSYIDICGFFFRDPPKYDPPPEIAEFLRKGPPPVYIGFGSIVLDDPEKMSSLLIEAVQNSGVRAIISRGWSNLGGPEQDNILYIGDCPHEWLFQHVSAVVHHGGAGTTACGLLNGRPTTIVPFFGDQPFWGNMVAAAGAGPKPIHHKSLNASNLTEAILFCLTPGALAASKQLSVKMSADTGVQTAVRSFHANLPRENVACDLLPDQPAVWTFKKNKKTLKLSKRAAGLLDQYLRLDVSRLETHQTKPIVIHAKYYDPVSSTTTASLELSKDVFKSLGGIVYEPYKEYQAAYRSKAKDSDHPDPFKPADVTANNFETSSRSSQGSGHHKGVKTAGAMAAASAKSLGNLYVKSVKGAVVDMPLATAEGLRSLPAMYGDNVHDNGTVTDWKSGAVVGGKSFFYNMSEGLTDIVVQPYKGAKKEGTKGAMKGIAKGTVSLATKPLSGVLGLLAYPGQGICKSIRTTAKFKTRGLIKIGRIVEGEYLFHSPRERAIDHAKVLDRFDELTQKGGHPKQWHPQNIEDL